MYLCGMVLVDIRGGDSTYISQPMYASQQSGVRTSERGEKKEGERKTEQDGLSLL